jgi:hypothetical protein
MNLLQGYSSFWGIYVPLTMKSPIYLAFYLHFLCLEPQNSLIPTTQSSSVPPSLFVPKDYTNK